MLDAADLLTSQDESIAMLQQVVDGAVTADIHDDAPLTLEQAVRLPELGGSYTVNPELRSPSEAVKVKTLRLVIQRGELACLRPNTKNLYVTRRQIREWLDKCRGPRTATQSSSSTRQDTTRQASSKARLTGTSTTKDVRSPTTPNTDLTSEELARRTLSQLRQRAGFTSRRNTPKS